MAILTAQQAVNTRDLPELKPIVNGGFDATTQEGQYFNSIPNSTHFRFGGFEIDLISNSGGFAGDMLFASGQTYAGTIREIVVRKAVGGETHYSITGTSIRLEDLYTDALDGKLDTIPSQVFSGDDTLNGSPFADILFGFAGNDTIMGNDGDDIINGGAGIDDIYGGKGADLLTGGADADVFHFLTLKDSTKKKAGRDTILDFSQAEGDKINLSAIDAKKGPGNQTFKFIKKKDFSEKKGELHYKVKKGDAYIEGDTSGNGKANFVIVVENVSKLKAIDFDL